MRHKAHVGLINTHAKGNGGHHHHGLLSQKARLMRCALLCREPSVVGQGGKALGGQPAGGLFGFFARQAIHNACVLRVLCFQKRQQLLPCVVLEANAVADIGAIKAHHKAGGILELQARRNLEPGLLVGGGGECYARYGRELLVQQTQLQVVGTKIMAPL